MSLIRWMGVAVLTLSSAALAQDTQPAGDAAAFYEKMRPAMVAVKYQWVGELSKQEVIGGGIVVREDGLVMVPIMLVSQELPDDQLKDFKVLVPSDKGDPEELDATFLGRDERSDMGFVQVSGNRKWTAVHFDPEAGASPLTVGKTVYGLGILPKSAGYKAYLNEAIVSANLRGEVPQVLVSGSLGNVGSPVFDDQFRAVGVVIPQQGQEMLLNDERAGLEGLLIPARFFERSSFFIDSIQNPPAADQPIHIPWIGVPGMTGVDEQFSKFLGLKDKPAVQLGDVVPDSPAAKAGLQPGNIIIAMNGKPLERGDLPEELPMIMRRNIMRKNVGDKLTFTVMTDKDTPPHDVTVTLEQRPRTPNQAKRYYAEDLGFVAREAVFTDAYEHKMNPSEPGVVIDTLRRDGAAATAKLAREDWVMQLNGEAVSTLDHFKEDYQTFRKGHPKDDVVLVVHTAAGQEETVNIEPPQTDVAPGGEGAQ